MSACRMSCWKTGDGKRNVNDTRWVLDASALLALLRSEPGGEVVADLFPHVVISSVNLSEVVAKLAEHGMPDQAIRSAFADLQLDVVDFDTEAALTAGFLRPATRSQGLSFGDRACLALAWARGTAAVTSDRSWLGLLPQVNVRVIR